MNRIRHLRRLATALAGLAGALLAFAAAAPAALAGKVPIPPGPAGITSPTGKVPIPPGPAGITSPTGPWIGQPPLPPGHVVVPLYRVHTVVIGGMPSWQIALIAAGAALCAATAAVLVYRAWTTLRKPVTAAA